jgi:eukaryotic-like serine/threonine-protein kinase
MSAPAASRKMIRRAVWGAAQGDAESRAYLQERVTLLFKLMFWSLLALMAFLAAMYTVYESETAPARRHWVYLTSTAGLVGMAFCWRVLLVRKQLAVSTLQRLDLAYSFFIGVAFALAAYLQNDLKASGYLSVVYSTFTVFARALIVPSTARRTLVASTLTFAPMTAVAAALSLEGGQDMPGAMYFVGYLLFSVAPILLATAGSDILYGLRQKVTAAQQLGQYTLDKKIGEGGNGAVYLAHHVLLRRPTAVKLVLPDRVGADTLERFEREVQHMSQLTHPNTVAVYDYGHSPDGVFYYAMEYLGGGIDLDKLVKTFGRQPSGRVAHILAQVCGALHEAHSNQIIHRDIKPANIILCQRGGVVDIAKVVDYGLVKEIAADTGHTAQIVLGTPAYIAPEVLTDPSLVGPAVDIYAVGAVGYFLLTGRRVFEGTTTLDICIQHVTKPVVPPSQVTASHVMPELEAILMRCLAKAPADRYASVRELRDALRAIPPPRDWSDADAVHWWRDFRDRDDRLAASSQAETRTITIELAAREQLFHGVSRG